MDFLASLLAGQPQNPDPQYTGECIVGASGIPLIAARIHPRAGRTYLGWRAAEVYCGWALDGGLQQLLQVLANRSPTDSKTVYIDPSVYRNQDLMGAIATVLQGYRLVSTASEYPVEGSIVIKAPEPNEHIVEVYRSSPTVTPAGVKMGAKPVNAGTVTVGAPASQAAQVLKNTELDKQYELRKQAFKASDPDSVAATKDYNAYADAYAAERKRQRATAYSGGMRQKRRSSIKRRSTYKRRRSVRKH